MTALVHARELLASAHSGTEVSHSALAELSAQARAAAPDLSEEEGRELYELFQEILTRAETGQRQTRKDIQRARSGRRALKGYGHLKPNRLAQRIRKRI